MSMMDIFGKLGEVKRKMEEIKSRLENVSVKGESESKKITVTMNANRRVTAIHIDDEFLVSTRKQELEELLEIAFNDASEKAQKISEAEMKAAGRDMLPGFPGLF